uniref:Uncharacterized protein n=1 Tax=Janibacter limosus TaxID=53458 RepID=A0AC61U427_9MICO|nr:hypothetical protein [Janibacter limosus]
MTRLVRTVQSSCGLLVRAGGGLEVGPAALEVTGDRLAGPLDEGSAPPLDDVEDVQLVGRTHHAGTVVLAVGLLGLPHVDRQGDEPRGQHEQDDRGQDRGPDQPAGRLQARLQWEVCGLMAPPFAVGRSHG